MTPQLFLSHSRRDRDFCDRFDNAAANMGLKRFRSEFEYFEAPAWKTIKNEMNKSIALFLLVGKELFSFQNSARFSPEEWQNIKYTQNWIAFEIGLACKKGIDVWVICDDLEINFPVPYLNNYSIYGFNLEEPHKRDWILGVFSNYKNRKRYPIGFNANFLFTCPYKECGAIFNLHSQIEPNRRMVCPTCLHYVEFPKGWLV